MTPSSGLGRPVLGPKPKAAAAASENGVSGSMRRDSATTRTIGDRRARYGLSMAMLLRRFVRMFRRRRDMRRRGTR